MIPTEQPAETPTVSPLPPRTDFRVSLRRWLALIIPALVVLAADQISKSLVIANLQLGESITPIPALRDYFGIMRSHNTGAAFSLLPQAGDLFLMIAIAMIIGVMIFYRRMPPGYWPERIALGLLLGGTSGNALDRLEFGYVVDWVHLQLPGVISNVSNFADHAIVIGILVIFLGSFRGSRNESAAGQEESPQA